MEGDEAGGGGVRSDLLSDNAIQSLFPEVNEHSDAMYELRGLVAMATSWSEGGADLTTRHNGNAQKIFFSRIIKAVEACRGVADGFVAPKILQDYMLGKRTPIVPPAQQTAATQAEIARVREAAESLITRAKDVLASGSQAGCPLCRLSAAASEYLGISGSPEELATALRMCGEGKVAASKPGDPDSPVTCGEDRGWHGPGE